MEYIYTCAAGLAFTISLGKCFHHPFHLLPLCKQLEASHEYSECCDKIKAVELLYANKLIKHLTVITIQRENRVTTSG